MAACGAGSSGRDRAGELLDHIPNGGQNSIELVVAGCFLAVKWHAAGRGPPSARIVIASIAWRVGGFRQQLEARGTVLDEAIRAALLVPVRVPLPGQVTEGAEPNPRTAGACVALQRMAV